MYRIPMGSGVLANAGAGIASRINEVLSAAEEIIAGMEAGIGAEHADAVGIALDRLITGAPSSYMSSAQRGLLASLRSRAAFVGASGTPQEGGSSDAMNLLWSMQDDLEVAIVEAEASGVPVMERSEREGAAARPALVALAVLAGVGLAVWALS